jgi:predicted HicB family RNase H-like nuclease
MNSMLEYLGYHAKIEFDAEEMIFTGEVFGINDSLNFHGTTVQEIEEMFHQSIDNYLTLCKECGKEPDREFKGSFNVRVSPETHRKAAIEAQKQNITLNQYVTAAIENSFYAKPVNEIKVYVFPKLYKDIIFNCVESNKYLMTNDTTHVITNTSTKREVISFAEHKS